MSSQWPLSVYKVLAAYRFWPEPVRLRNEMSNQLIGYLDLDWPNRPVLCSCAVSRITRYCRFMKFYRWKSFSSTSNFLIVPAHCGVISCSNNKKTSLTYNGEMYVYVTILLVSTFSTNRWCQWPDPLRMRTRRRFGLLAVYECCYKIIARLQTVYNNLCFQCAWN